MIFLALALQAADTPMDTRYKACLDLATSNPEAARNEAERFRLAGGGAQARQCLGLAYAQEERWRDAAIAFEAAAQEATAAKDPLAWLLSATLARRTKDLPRAQSDIAQALKLSADDASVQLEAGNIAALAGNADAARTAWEAAVKIAPTSPAGQNARAALGQFDAPPPAATPTPAPPAK